MIRKAAISLLRAIARTLSASERERERLIREVLPSAAVDVRALLHHGVAPTESECVRSVRGYAELREYFTHEGIIRMVVYQ